MQAQIFYEQIVNEAQLGWLLLIATKGKKSYCYEHPLILKKKTAKYLKGDHGVSAISRHFLCN